MSDLMRSSIDSIWPKGSAWVPAPGSDLDNLLDASAANWEVIREWLAALASIRDPKLTTFLEDLEAELGVLPNSDLTEAQRRERLIPLLFERSSNGSVDAMQSALDAAGFNVQVHENSPAADPEIYLNEAFQMTAGTSTGFAGRSDAFAGRTGGELLVNGDIFTTQKLFTSGAGTETAYAGTGFSAGEYEDLIRVKIEYPTPTDPGDWPLIFFVGGDLLLPTDTIFTYDGAASDLDVSGQGTFSTGLSVSSDGLHLAVSNPVVNKVFFYTHNGTTFVYDGASNDLDMSGLDNNATDVSYSSDGLHLAVSGADNDKVYFLTFGTAYIGSTLTHDGAPNDLDVSGQDATPTGVSYSSDGLHLIVSGATNDKVYFYTFGTAYVGSTITYDEVGNDLDVSGQDGIASGVTYGSDGKHIWLSGTSNHKVYAYISDTAYTGSRFNHRGDEFDLDVSGLDLLPKGVAVSPDSKQLSVLGDEHDKVYFYTATSPDLALAQVPAIQEQEFKRLILKLKPAHTWAVLAIDYV